MGETGGRGKNSGAIVNGQFDKSRGNGSLVEGGLRKKVFLLRAGKHAGKHQGKQSNVDGRRGGRRVRC